MQWSLEVIVLPVSDLDRSIGFYRDQVGFHLDHDTHNEHMHVAQLTPPGSGCSIVIGDLPSQREMAPGSMRALQLIVPDGAAAREELLARGVPVSELMVITEADAAHSSASATQTETPGRCRRSAVGRPGRCYRPITPVSETGPPAAPEPRTARGDVTSWKQMGGRVRRVDATQE